VAAALTVLGARGLAGSAPLFDGVSSLDGYESDDNYLKAKPIVINDTVQLHNFHYAGDEDWGKFYGLAGRLYCIKTINPESRCNTIIEIYDTDGRQLLEPNFTYVTVDGEAENVEWWCTQDGIYFIRVRQVDWLIFGEQTGYGLIVSEGTAPFDGSVIGRVKAARSGASLADVKAKLMDTAGVCCDSFVTNRQGRYRLLAPPGSYKIVATAPGYKNFNGTVTVRELETVIKDFAMAPRAGSRADLVIGAVIGPTAAMRETSIRVTLKIRNRGKGKAKSFRVSLYLSRDKNIELGKDQFLGSYGLAGLAAGADSASVASVTIPADVEPGTYHLGAIADTRGAVAETRESNNSRASLTAIVIR
jgi:hypothetical protein